MFASPLLLTTFALWLLASNAATGVLPHSPDANASGSGEIGEASD